MAIKQSVKEEISIDKNALDFECMRQSMLYAEASEELASTTFRKETLKLELDKLEAEVDMEIRADPEEYGLNAKPTETAIRATLSADKRIVKKKEEFVEATFDANVAMGMKNAYEHKKTCLELLVKLYISGYWADPVVSEVAMKKNVGEVVEKEMMESLEQNPRMKRRKNG